MKNNEDKIIEESKRETNVWSEDCQEFGHERYIEHILKLAIQKAREEERKRILEIIDKINYLKYTWTVDEFIYELKQEINKNN